MSIVAGLHVPVIPLVEVVAKVGTPAPAQMLSEVPKLNVGVALALTVTTKVVIVAHWPVAGVKVYVADV